MCLSRRSSGFTSPYAHLYGACTAAVVGSAALFRLYQSFDRIADSAEASAEEIIESVAEDVRGFSRNVIMCGGAATVVVLALSLIHI